jgi:hypothetical protein
MGMTFFSNLEKPQRLPSSPAKAETILGINTDWWEEADPIIQAVDGNSYIYTSENGEYNWRITQLKNGQGDSPCVQKDIQRIEKHTGEITSCRMGYPMSEWCPSPKTIFLVTTKGEVWADRKNQPCYFFIKVDTILFGIIGLVIGILFVARKRLFKKRPTKRAPDAGDSAHIPSSFLRLVIFLVGRLRRPCPSAGNANR